MNNKLILALIVLSVFVVACPQERQPPTPPSAPEAVSQPMPVPGSTVQETVVTIIPSIAVSDQTTSTKTVKIASVTLDKAGYVVLHSEADGKPGPVVAKTGLLQANTYTDIEITVELREGANKFFAMPHYDDGDGTYEFPGDDVPITVDGAVLVKPLTVTYQAPKPAPTATQSYSIDANDNRASPSSLTIPKGTEYTITFNVDSTGVYYGGLSFRSSKFNSPDKVSPGNSWTTPTLTADESFTVGAYWPSSGVHKWDLQVTVS